MKTYLLIFTLLLCVSFRASAQDTIPDFKHDIGMNVFIVLNGIAETTQTPFSLMYKIYSAPNKATRLGIDISYGLTKQERDQDIQNNQHQDYGSLALVVGREFQRNIAKKWIFYYGGDLMPQYSFNTFIQKDNDRETSRIESRNYALSVRPFMGVRFNVAPMLYLSVEANASLTYNVSTSSNEYTDATFTDSESRQQGLNFGTNRVTGVFLYYRF